MLKTMMNQTWLDLTGYIHHAMTLVKDERKKISKYVSDYIKTALEADSYHQIDEEAKFDKCLNRLQRIKVKVVLLENAWSELVPLLTHENDLIKLDVASILLNFTPEESISCLHQMAKNNNGLYSDEARCLLLDLKYGRLSIDIDNQLLFDIPENY